MTDVTGFAPIGHLLEWCRGAGQLTALLMASTPLLPSAAALGQAIGKLDVTI